MSSPREEHDIRLKIKTLADQQMTPYQIAQKLGVDYKTAVKWSHRDGVKHRFNTDMDKKMTPNTKRAITGMIKDRVGMSINKCVKRLNMSAGYVRGTDWGRVARHLKQKPLLSKKNIKDRLKFALFVQMEGFCEDSRFGRRLRKNTLFTDESPIELIPTLNRQNTRVRTNNKSLLTYEKPKNSIKIMVAGGITSQGVTELHVLKKGKTIDGNYYATKILPIYINALDNN